MTENTQNPDTPPGAESQQDVAKASDAKAEASPTAGDELTGDDLEAVAGGIFKMGARQSADL